MIGPASCAPVVLLVFNRPDHTRKVFERVRSARPHKLFVVADGPRPGNPEDHQLCRQTREIFDRIDWDCEVGRLYAECNLGCARRVSSGLDWAFTQADRAIILEDDCVPHPDFFPFCAELLERYQDDDRVMAIGGTNFQLGRRRTPDSYYFSRYPHCWGWATWAKAWSRFDFRMSLWPDVRDGKFLDKTLGSWLAVRYWRRMFSLVFEGAVDSWAYRWTFACWSHGGLTALPAWNLVSNIGFDGRATHTLGQSRFARMSTYPLEFPLRHPSHVERNRAADRFTEGTNFSGTYLGRAVRAGKALLRQPKLLWTLMRPTPSTHSPAGGSKERAP